MILIGQHPPTSTWQREVRYIFPLNFFAIAADDVFILHIQFYLKFTKLSNQTIPFRYLSLKIIFLKVKFTIIENNEIIKYC